jgi:hypothetical protein
MRYKEIPGGKKEVVMMSFQNEDTVAIKRGGPVALKALASNPGVGAVSADTLAAANQQTFFGFNAGPEVAVGAFGDAQVFGFFEYARILVTTRAASTDVWASYPAVALYDILAINSVASAQAVARSGAGSANLAYPMIAAFSYASATTQASSLSTSGVGDALLSVIEARVFVRAM